MQKFKTKTNEELLLLFRIETGIRAVTLYQGAFSQEQEDFVLEIENEIKRRMIPNPPIDNSIKF